MEIRDFITIPNLITSNKTLNVRMNKVIKGYSFYYISDQSHNEILNNISTRIIESQIIIIDQFKMNDEEMKDQYFIFSFKKTIVLIQQKSKSLISKILSKEKELMINFLSSTQKVFEQNEYEDIKYSIIEDDQDIQEEINAFNKNISLINILNGKQIKSEIWRKVCPYISTYFIKQSYLKLNKDRISSFLTNQCQQKTQKILSEDEYFVLKEDIDKGTVFSISIVYWIENEELLALKKPYSNDDVSRLFTREVENYKRLNHPFIPKFYGSIQNKKILFIELIKGKTLLKTGKINFEDKIKIIYQLLLIVQYFYYNQLINRDIKPDNIMIDENKNVVMIDYDQMIKVSDIQYNEYSYILLIQKFLIEYHMQMIFIHLGKQYNL